MAPKQTSKRNSADHSKNTFAETVHVIARRFSVFTVFNDFLTMAMAACTRNFQTKKTWYEAEYLETIEKYIVRLLHIQLIKDYCGLLNVQSCFLQKLY
jgi:hypothetical protein